jgi:LAO/AO transport system kinase
MQYERSLAHSEMADDDLVTGALRRDHSAIAKLITQAESGGSGERRVLRCLFPHTGHAHVVGVTGAPGTGKSTLISHIVRLLRAQDETVGVIAVDPSSSLTGGALLGDRLRMRDLSGDDGVFIRSLASRGNRGGLARAAYSAVNVLDAAGFAKIIVETVGTGQDEIDVASAAHTTILVESPAGGDEIQALKAGLLELADIVVVNKSDLAGARARVRSLKMAVGRCSPGAGEEADWRVPLLLTSAMDGSGAEAVVQAISDHCEYLRSSGLWETRERGRAEAELLGALRRELMDWLAARWSEQVLVREWVDRIVAREVDVYSAADALVND